MRPVSGAEVRWSSRRVCPRPRRRSRVVPPCSTSSGSRPMPPDRDAGAPGSPPLSTTQLGRLAEVGEERAAQPGDVLFTVGDRRYPFIAILEGEVAILDAAGHEIIRHGASAFVGELSLLSGQTAYLTAVATRPLRYVAVDRDALRPLLFEDGALGDVLLAAFIARREALQQRDGVGLEIIGPGSSPATRRLVDFAR